MSTVNTIIDDFIKNNDTFRIDEVKILVSQVLLGQDYNNELYNKLVENNFQLFKNNLVKKLQKNKISVDNFNKLLDENKKITSLVNLNNYIDSSDDDTIYNLFKNLNKDNKYVSTILFIWNSFSFNDNISIKPNKVKFIEKTFEGNYEDYLYFIIIRITKLNLQQLEKLYPNQQIDKPAEESLSKSSSSDSFKLNNDIIDNFDDNETKDNNYDIDYVKILELNINDLQTQVQNIYDNILPRFYKMESDIEEIKTSINNHRNYTKNSVSVLEERFNKLFEIVKQIKL